MPSEPCVVPPGVRLSKAVMISCFCVPGEWTAEPAPERSGVDHNRHAVLRVQILPRRAGSAAAKAACPASSSNPRRRSVNTKVEGGRFCPFEFPPLDSDAHQFACALSHGARATSKFTENGTLPPGCG
jgi:hypothetical protein